MILWCAVILGKGALPFLSLDFFLLLFFVSDKFHEKWRKSNSWLSGWTYGNGVRFELILGMIEDNTYIPLQASFER